MERLGLIADPSKLKHDKAGQISFLDVGAIKGAALFKKDQFAWMEQVLLPELAKRVLPREVKFMMLSAVFLQTVRHQAYFQQCTINVSKFIKMPS